MGRLADLASSRGMTLSALADAVRVKPLLLVRIDAGDQPMPRFLAKLVAGELLVELVAVLVACPLTTEIDQPRMLIPIPPRQGEDQAPARIYPTAAVRLPSPAGGELYAFLGPVEPSTSGSSVIMRYDVKSGGGIVLARSLLDSEPNGYPGGLLGCINGAIANDGSLWVGGDNLGLDPLTFRVNASTLELLGPTYLYTWSGFGLHTFAKSAVDPVSGRVWVTIGDGFLYAFTAASVDAGPEVVDLTNAGFEQQCGALVFPGDGYLYVLCYSSENTAVIIQKIDPRPGFVAIVAATPDPVPDPTGVASLMLEWVEGAGLFYSGATGGFNTWDRSTLQLAAYVGDLSSVAYLGGRYDVETDSFWMLAFTFVDFYAVRIPRTTGVPDYSGPVFNPQFAAYYEPAISNERVAFYPGTSLDTGLRNIFAYSMDGDPTLLYSLPCGTGPNPNDGDNNLIGSLVYHHD